MDRAGVAARALSVIDLRGVGRALRATKMIRRPLLLALALSSAGCGRPASRDEASTTPSRDEQAAQIVREQAAEANVETQVTLARLSKEVADLHVEMDRLKAGKAALSDQILEGRLQALESRAAPAAAPATMPGTLPVTTPSPVSTASPVLPKPPRHATPTKPTSLPDKARGKKVSGSE